MRQQIILSTLLLLTLFASLRCIVSQTPSYNLSVAVDEIALTFHASDAQGLPLTDLKVDELRLLDNGRSPRRILSFQPWQNRPIRAGVLLDTSESMSDRLPIRSHPTLDQRSGSALHRSP